jgi:hypothetical protein
VTAAYEPYEPSDGRSAFDFIFGTWIVHNRKLRDVTDPECEEWVEFDARSEAFPVLDRTATSTVCT